MIIVSGCLAGINCNYISGCKENEEIVKLVKEGKAIPVCPEQLGGLTTPRDPVEIKNNRVLTNKNIDVTDKFVNGAMEVLNICKKYDCDKAILKSRSPSCGCGKIYDGTFTKTIIDGDGITTRILKENGIEVISCD